MYDGVSSMKIYDLSGSFETNDVTQLAHRLRSVHIDECGAFHVSENDDVPFMSVHFNGDVAYVYYWDDDGHPGSQPTDMTPPEGPDSIHLDTDGSQGGAFDMPASTLVDVETAITRIIDFATSREVPRGIGWTAL